MYFLGALAWAAICIFIARATVKLLSKTITRYRIPSSLTVILTPILFLAPLTDELIGKHQFDRLCEAAKDVKIYGTHPVGEELYTSDGKWKIDYLEDLRRSGRISDPFEEKNRLQKIYASLIREGTDQFQPQVVPAAIVIRWYQYKVTDGTNGRLLAAFDAYGTAGGWLSQHFENPFLVRPQCFPLLVARDQLKFAVLPFSPTEKAK